MKKPPQPSQTYTFLFYAAILLPTAPPSSSSSYNNNETTITNTDSILLLNFKSSIPNPSLLPSWLPNHDPCLSFHHITCDNTTHIITSLNLSSLPINTDLSSISSHLLPLHSLSSLSLKSTNLTFSSSPFPNTTSCSPSLSSLDLSMNSISSDFSHLLFLLSSCSNLKELNLSGNHLTSFSSSVSFNRLEILDLSFNELSWLPTPAGGSNLRHMSIRGNRAEGDLTQFLKNSRFLVFLDVSSNRFNTSLPLFYQLRDLRYLDLSDNDFHGEVFDSFVNCDRLVFLNLSSNRFHGDLPVFSNAGSLQTVDLSGNSFGGDLRGEKKWDFCDGLISIDLSLNKFHGFLPAGIGSCSSLEAVDLSGNLLFGDVSGEGGVWRMMKSLRRLILSNNSFNGGIPWYLPEILTVEYLDLSSNNLTGSIPNLCSGYNNISILKEVYLQNNGLTGGIPETLFNCTELVSLDLSLNYLTGSIPGGIGGMKKMRDLVVWMNQIEGEIPNELGGLGLLESLILDFNNLGGGIPKGLVNCTRLVWVSLSNNMLVGRIPAWIGRMSRLAILTLGNNSFGGEIPSQIGDCRSLVWLDLNSNMFVGSIPSTLFKQSGKIAAALFTRKRYAYVKNDGDDKGCHGAGNLLEFSGIRQEQLGRISAKSPCDYTRVYGGMTQPTFNHNGSLIFLDLSYNHLSSPIPLEIGHPFYLSVLNLAHNNLSGSIPSELGSLSSLNILDLSFNCLQGTIPSSLSRLSSLSELDLSNNLLEGPIPNSAQFDSFPEYKYGNNTGLCGFPLRGCVRPVETAVRRRAGGLWVGAIVVCVVAAGAMAAGLVVGRRRKRGAPEKKKKKTDSGLMEVGLGELVEGTNGFEEGRKIGSGGFGEVYEARLRDGRVVAVKRLKGTGAEGGEREFEAEVETIGRVSHKNVMRLLGYCREGGERMLVYEYMKNGSVEEVVVDGKGGVRMGWEARRRVVEGAGRGLEYLHHRSVPRIIHRDMKSSNVLLDEQMEARVSDFGMAREVVGGETHRSVSTVVGTPGYVPPEYYQSCRCTTKGDVYSYGVVVVEVMTGRRATDGGELGEAGNLVGWVKRRMGRGEEVLDRRMVVGGGDEEEMMDYLKVALLCVEERPWKRPSMMEVMAMFREIRVRSGRMDDDEEDDGWP